MAQYIVKFSINIVLDGKMTLEAEDDTAAEMQANIIERHFRDNPPVFWSTYKETKYKSDWEEYSFDIDIIEVI